MFSDCRGSFPKKNISWWYFWPGPSDSANFSRMEYRSTGGIPKRIERKQLCLYSLWLWCLFFWILHVDKINLIYLLFSFYMYIAYFSCQYIESYVFGSLKTVRGCLSLVFFLFRLQDILATCQQPDFVTWAQNSASFVGDIWPHSSNPMNWKSQIFVKKKVPSLKLT